MWLRNAKCLGEMSWSQGLSACNSLSSGSCGLNDGSVAGDWRMPNRKELLSLIDHSLYDPSLPQGHLFTNVRSGYFWSSTSVAEDTDEAWLVTSYSGVVVPATKTLDFYNVWPVRGCEDGSDLPPVVETFSADTLCAGIIDCNSNPLHVCFKCIANDPDGGEIDEYILDYGDGSSSESNATGVFEHTYDAMDTTTYQATCTAVDDEGATSTPEIEGVTVPLDSDGDGLWNEWERCGYDYNDDGDIDVDLSAMGAHPDIPDIFVEVDYLVTRQRRKW
jgi:hypothetical protein